MKKIKIYIFHPYSRIGGADLSLSRLINNLNSNKYNITVFTDKTIIAHRHEEKETAQIVINRYTGELVQGFDKSGDNIIDVKIRLNCKPLEQKF